MRYEVRTTPNGEGHAHMTGLTKSQMQAIYFALKHQAEALNEDLQKSLKGEPVESDTPGQKRNWGMEDATFLSAELAKVTELLYEIEEEGVLQTIETVFTSPQSFEGAHAFEWLGI